MINTSPTPDLVSNFSILPTARERWVGWLCLAVLLAGAFAAAWLTRGQALFSLLPSGSSVPDLQPAQRLDLHRTFFTIWAALILVTPALCLFPFRHRSARAARYWLVFWSMALLAFLVHFYWAVEVIYGHDWERIRHTPRVSAPVLDTVFMLWWVLDVALAWGWRARRRWVEVQRTLVHGLAFVLFFMGAAREGELLTSRLLGYALAAALLASVLWWLLARLKTRRASAG